MQPQIEFINVTAWLYPKGDICCHDMGNLITADSFWMSGDTYFADPRKFMKHIPELDTWIPHVNLVRFFCEPTANNMQGYSHLQFRIQDQGATDTFGPDSLHFRAAFKRHKPVHHVEPALFTLVYTVSEFVVHTQFGKDTALEYNCLGELDFARIADICINPEAAV